MAEVHLYEDSAGANDVGGALWPEGMPARNVNNSGREDQAAQRRRWNEAEWFQYGDGSGEASITRTGNNQFQVSTSNDLTAIYHVGRRVRITGSGTGTVYTSITASSFSSPTQTVTVGSTGLQNEALTVALSIISAGETSSLPVVSTELEEVKVTLSDNGANAGPFIDALRIRSAPAAADNLGQVRLLGTNSGGNQITYAALKGQIANPQSGNEQGRVFVAVRAGGVDLDTLIVEPGSARVRSVATGGAAGPDLILDRDQGGQPVTGTVGRLLWRHNSANNANVDGGFLEGYLQGNAVGQETMRVRLVTISNGTRSTKLDVGDNIQMTVDLSVAGDAAITGSLDVDGGLTVDEATVLSGLSAQSLSLSGDLSVGGEISGDVAFTGDTVGMAGTLSVDGAITTSDGAIQANRDGATPAAFNRNSTDGVVVAIQQDGVTEGTISVSGNTVSYGTFTGEHWSDFPGQGLVTGGSADPPRGTLLSSTGEPYKGEKALPLVEITSKRADPAIYGVFGGRSENGVQVYALGTAHARCIGAVEVGTLLQASDVPGVAEGQTDDVVRASTLGKVTMADDRVEERLVAVTLMSG